MNSTIPADLLELKARFETWRANRKYACEPIPNELWNAAADLNRRYTPSLMGRVLKIDPSRLKKPLISKPSADWFDILFIASSLLTKGSRISDTANGSPYSMPSKR